MVGLGVLGRDSVGGAGLVGYPMCVCAVCVPFVCPVCLRPRATSWPDSCYI